METSNLVVGCGLTGAIIARQLAENLDEETLLIEKREHVGGNIYDYLDAETGVMIHKYGPHVFHTNDKGVWDYLSRFTSWHYFVLKVKASLYGDLYSVPLNLAELDRLFPAGLARRLQKSLIGHFGFGARISIYQLISSDDALLKLLADFIINNIFKGYTEKQWGSFSLEDIDHSILERIPFYTSPDCRYFTDKYQGIPDKGYTRMVMNILDHKNIKVLLNTDYAAVASQISAKRLIYTGMIDEYYQFSYGHLPYRSLAFDLRHYPHLNDYQHCPHINYPNNYDFTRSIEYCHYLPLPHRGTCVVYEYPQTFQYGQNEPFYPVPDPENSALYEKYARLDSAVHFAGRLGKYKYFNMDQAARAAMDLATQIITAA